MNKVNVALKTPIVFIPIVFDYYALVRQWLLVPLELGKYISRVDSVHTHQPVMQRCTGG